MSHQFHQDGSRPPAGSTFVFGSNLAGQHLGGAARAAVDHFGAVYGVAFGMTGNSYAIPTMSATFEVLSLIDIANHVEVFLAHARANPDSKFFVTRIGCGIAGYEDFQIAPLFKDAPDNCSFAESWADFIGSMRGAEPGHVMTRQHYQRLAREAAEQ